MFDVVVDIVIISRNSSSAVYNKKPAPRNLYSPVNCNLVQTLIFDKECPVSTLSF